MIGSVVALALFALSTGETSAAVDQGPALTIDACVAVDEPTVREVMELELRGARSLPTSVAVQCVDGAQKIRVQRGASPEGESVRTIHLAPLADDAGPAERQARSRELALAIAELIRRQDAPPAPPPAEPPPPPAEPPPVPPPPPPAVEVIAAAPTPPADQAEARWQLGVLATVEYFSGGKMLAGGDLLLASHLGRWYFVELRVGGRLGGDEPLPAGRLTARAGAAAVAAGVSFWSARHIVGTALALRGHGYLVQFRAEETDLAAPKTALLGAFALAAEPRFMVAVATWLHLEATAAVGFLPRGIKVRIQGTENQSISGLVVSGNLGGVFTF